MMLVLNCSGSCYVSWFLSKFLTGHNLLPLCLVAQFTEQQNHELYPCPTLTRNVCKNVIIIVTEKRGLTEVIKQLSAWMSHWTFQQ